MVRTQTIEWFTVGEEDPDPKRRCSAICKRGGISSVTGEHLLAYKANFTHWTYGISDGSTSMTPEGIEKLPPKAVKERDRWYRSEGVEQERARLKGPLVKALRLQSIHFGIDDKDKAVLKSFGVTVVTKEEDEG